MKLYKNRKNGVTVKFVSQDKKNNVIVVEYIDGSKRGGEGKLFIIFVSKKF